MKRYLDEPGHEQVRRLDDLVVSRLVLTEATAATWRAHRDGRLPLRETTRLLDRLREEMDGGPLAEQVPVDPIVVRAAELAGRHSLRSLDALQLGSALAVRSATSDVTFGTFDRRLAEAAVAEGLELTFPLDQSP